MQFDESFSDSPTISRRSVAKGIAWSAPAITLVAAAPAFASSQTPPGLQGWVSVGRSCGGSSGGYQPITVTIDGDGDGTRYPIGQGYGLYVFNTTSTSTITNASITFYLPNQIINQTWTLVGSAQGWSSPMVIPTQDRPGFTGYKTTYSGAWTFHAAAGSSPAYTIASGVPRFTGTGRYPTGQGLGYCSSLPIWATRCVTVNGSEICFSRTVTL